jgi:cytochrome P450
VRASPELVSAAVHESLRYEAPVRGFTRFAAERYEAGEVTIPAGERVLVLYGSANRDERRYADPDRFDPTRDARDHLAFGQGVHRCADGHLAQLELEALLGALVARVSRIEVGEPEVLMSNMLRGWRSFPARFEA